MPLHPAQRFQAPDTILAGTPLKDLLNDDLIQLIGKSFAAVHAQFDRRHFQRAALQGPLSAHDHA